ncbi:hypothetical protein A1O1_00917 [Capronia coronata CBS 617.96]|uniref:Histone-lysine N-methyltransferase EZH2 n=1 Tax=Capronia coronata CBS 617.96 TaxID=1182541 RepID=W9YTB9_9EURO|nr:uncharacterized protein A1O1_00917 [Capronia coronata CBS 617.96]EXJ95793.1 hypothetical protein A1O1_00917 [Capronia coronata CBS 617.96]
MSELNRYSTASNPRTSGQRLLAHDFQHTRPPSRAQALRQLHAYGLSEVIVLSDSEDEAPRSRMPGPPGPPRQSVDLTRESVSSGASRSGPFAAPPRPSPRPPYSPSHSLEGVSGSERDSVRSTIIHVMPYIGRPAVPAQASPTPSEDVSPLRQTSQAAAVNEYHAPPQSGSRVVFPTFSRASIYSPPITSQSRSSGRVDSLGSPLKPPQPQQNFRTDAVKSTCIACIRGKLKCDGAKPCGQCRQRGDRGCIYSMTSSPSSQAPAYPMPVSSAMLGKPAHSIHSLQRAEAFRPVRFGQPAQPAQLATPVESVQSAQPAQIPQTIQRQSMVITLKLPAAKMVKEDSQADAGSSEQESGLRNDNPRSNSDRDGSTPKPYIPNGQPRDRALLRREQMEQHRRDNPLSPKPDDMSIFEYVDFLFDQLGWDKKAHTSEHGYEVVDDNEKSGLLNLPRLHTGIEAKVEEFESLMEEVQKQLQAWREMSVQGDLRQASIDMKTYSKPRLASPAQDPFRAITAERRSAANASCKPDLHGQAKPQDKLNSKKLTAIRASEHPFWTGGVLLPKYKSIGRVSASFLAPNYRTAKYRPYDAEDEIQDPDATEKYAELEQRFNNNYPGLRSQRHCQELVWLWKPWAEELFVCLGIKTSDVLYFFTQDHFDPDRELTYPWPAESARAWREEQMRRCRTCELADPESRWTHFSETFNSLPKPDDRSLALAGLAAHAFHQRTGVSLWHVAIGGLLQPRYEDPQAMAKRSPNFCVICFRHHCPDHGSYEEPNDEDHGAKDAEEFKAYINDEEQDHNLRKFMSLPIRPRKDNTKHTCGVFCIDPSQKLSHLIGRQRDGSIGGESRLVSQGRQVLADNELCSSSCFWDVTSRRDIKISEVKFQPFMSQSQKLLVDKLIGFYLNNKRGPCLISRIIKDVSCLMVFNYTIFYIASVPHPLPDSGATSDSSAAPRHHNIMRKKKKPLPMIDVSRSAELDQRPPFMPCSHDGPCHTNPACTCSRSKVHCERFCGCDDSCKRRFRGCSCTTRGSKICFKDSRCECWKLNRECDPSLCGKCGVVEVLDSANKYKDEIRRGRCRNNRIQLGLPAPTSKAPSQVQGYGLYSRADIPSGEFIGEYTGEIVSISEGDRRGAMYHVLNQEYLFVINKGQEIDASNNGNKMRFMNNSQLEENINVEPKKLLCSGVVRVGLFAKRFVKAGEELLYNYNYPESVVRNFWEPGERPSTARRLIPAGSERLARTTGANKLADEKVSKLARVDSSQSPLSRHPKRKRPVVESPLATHRFDRVLLRQGDDSESSAYGTAPVPEIDDSQDSDYETNGLVSDEGDLEDGPDDESDVDVDEPKTASGRRASTRRSLQGGAGRSERSQSNSKAAGTSRSRERRRQNVDKDNSRSRGAASSSVVVKDKKELAAVKRKRRIMPYDKRLGGRAQQQAWRTRRLRESVGLSMSPSSTSTWIRDLVSDDR